MRKRSFSSPFLGHQIHEDAIGMIPFLIPHPEIPNHFDVPDEYIIRTNDLDAPKFLFSRILINNYIPGKGFSTFHAQTRIQFFGYVFNNAANIPIAVLDPFQIEQEIESLMEPGRCLILHYGDQRLQTIVNGVSPSVFENYPKDYSRYYYDTL